MPAAGEPLFQAAAANLNPWTEVKVDRKNPARGPLLVISGEKDRTVPRAYRPRLVQEAGEEQGAGDRVRGDARTRPRPDHRQRLAVKWPTQRWTSFDAS